MQAAWYYRPRLPDTYSNTVAHGRGCLDQKAEDHSEGRRGLHRSPSSVQKVERLQHFGAYHLPEPTLHESGETQKVSE